MKYSEKISIARSWCTTGTTTLTNNQANDLNVEATLQVAFTSNDVDVQIFIDVPAEAGYKILCEVPRETNTDFILSDDDYGGQWHPDKVYHYLLQPLLEYIHSNRCIGR